MRARAFQTSDMEREKGKMTSQERFWQARLLSKESEHRGELSAIHQQLEALKATTEDAKADLASMKNITHCYFSPIIYLLT